MRKGQASIWKSSPAPKASDLARLRGELDMEEIFLKLLLQRGVRSLDEAKQFFRPTKEMLHDPFLMKDMDRAVDRIQQAITANEKLLIYGDYDVDGTTAVSLLASFLETHYSNFETYIPDRYREGYGVSQTGIDYAEERGIGLIIALDCGIKALDKVAYAKGKGIDFIICDHHTPGPEIPDASAVLDPKRPDCEYPFKGLSGCGVGFKLCQALNQKWGATDDQLWSLSDLLALSIGADIVPMNGENRVLAFYGLEQINRSPSPGLAALLKQAGPREAKLDISDLVFILAPRINAAGRLDHGQKAVDLLRGKNLELLPQIAAEIEQRNLDRKDLDQKIAAEALAQIAAEIPEEACSTVVFKKDWHKGVIGIVASRLIESYYRPTVVLTQSGDKLAGSARSVLGFNLYKALEDCQSELIQFGGHPAAAGMTLAPEQLPGFKKAFEASVARRIKPEQKQPILHFDLEVEASDLDPKFYRLIQRFAPFGPENLAPTLLCRGLLDNGSRLVGADRKHLKLALVDSESGICLDGIAFNAAEHLKTLQQGLPVAILFHLELNVYRGTANLQLRVLDLKAESQLNEI